MIEDSATTRHASEMAKDIHDTIVPDFVDEEEWVVRVEGERIVVEEV